MQRHNLCRGFEGMRWSIVLTHYTFYHFHLVCWLIGVIDNMDMTKKIHKPWLCLNFEQIVLLNVAICNWVMKHSMNRFPISLDCGCFVFGRQMGVSHFRLWPGKVACEMLPCWPKDHCFLFLVYMRELGYWRNNLVLFHSLILSIY